MTKKIIRYVLFPCLAFAFFSIITEDQIRKMNFLISCYSFPFHNDKKTRKLNTILILPGFYTPELSAIRGDPYQVSLFKYYSIFLSVLEVQAFSLTRARLSA